MTTTSIANTLHTPHAAQSGVVASGQKLAFSGGGFLDLIFASITAPSGQKGETPTDLLGSLLQNTGTDTNDFLTMSADIANLNAATPIDITGDNLLTADSAAISSADASTLSSSDLQNKLLSFIHHLLAGLPAQEKPADVQVLQDKIIQVLDAAEQGTSPALIAAGLTPEELTQLMEELKSRTEPGDSLLAGLIKLLPPKTADKEALFTPRNLLLAQAAAKKRKAEDDVAALAQSALITTQATAKETSLEDLSAELNSLISGESTETTDDLGKTDGGFDRVLKILEQAQQKAGKAPDPTDPAAKAGAAAKNPVPGPVLSTVPGNSAPLPFNMSFASGLSGEIFPDGMDWSHIPGQQAPGMTVTGPAMMTSLVTHGPQATQPHPATQMLAATITKQAMDGENKNITVRMDPPELGRIEVRMQFTKDKTLKTHMIVEKQETFLMMQRDAHLLEKALQDAGIDSGGGLNLELAQDGNLFSGEGGEGGSNDSGGSGGTEPEETEEIIETTMDWYVNPETGMTHYDLWA